MGILEQMRSGSDSTFMQVVLAMVVVAFVGMYVRPSGERSGVVAVVNGVKIMDTDFNRIYTNRLRSLEAQQKRVLSDAEQKQVAEDVKQALIEKEVVLQEAHRLGLEVSDKEVGRAIVEQFRNPRTGKFSVEDYERQLKNMRFTKDAFQESMRDDLLEQKIRMLAFMGASISAPAIRESYVEENTKVRLKYVEVRPTAFDGRLQIDAEELAAFAEANAERVEETYEDDFDRLYNHPEQVRLSMIRLAALGDGPLTSDLRPVLMKLREEIEDGADFAEVARRWSEDPSALKGGDLELRPVPQLPLEDRDQIEGLTAGQMSKVFSTTNDVRLVRVEERVEPSVDALEDVRDAIAERLYRDEEVPKLAVSFARDELLEQWKAASEVPEELLSGYGIAAVDSGLISTRSQGGMFGPPQALLDAARRADEGEVLPEVVEARGGLFVGQLVEREDPDMVAFEERQTTIREEVLARRRQSFYDGWVADLKARAVIQ